MTWKDGIKKDIYRGGRKGPILGSESNKIEYDEDKTALIGVTQAKLEQIEAELYSLSIEQLEKLYDALDDILMEF